MASTRLLQASSITVQYDSLTSANKDTFFSNLAKFTVSGTGPRDPGTLTELVQLDPANPLKITAQYTQNSFAPVDDKTWSGKQSFKAELGQFPQNENITVEVAIFGVKEQGEKILSFTLFPGASQTSGSADPSDPL